MATLGLIISEVIFLSTNVFIKQSTALLFAILVGFFFRKTESKFPKIQEAIIGVTFIFTASFSILLLADHPESGKITINYLSGQLLFIS